MRDVLEECRLLIFGSFIVCNHLDAMTSGLIYAFQYMADYPEVFAKVRQEQLELRGGPDVPITLDVLDESPYLRAFVKEVLRIRREFVSLFAAYHNLDESMLILPVSPPPFFNSTRDYGPLLGKESIPNFRRLYMS